VAVKELPLQIVAVIFVITAFEFTVTVTVKVAPEHAPDLGVTV
jgi:hypothetical protein